MHFAHVYQTKKKRKNEKENEKRNETKKIIKKEKRGENMWSDTVFHNKSANFCVRVCICMCN